ncbi:MAG TPA: phospholipase D-like domain-containing protein [Gemmatimonadales bacterium]
MSTAALGASLADRALDRVSGGRPIPGNKVELLFDGPQVYPAMLQRIAEARRWVHFDNYIIRDDRTGWQFAEALIAKAREGARVRVLTDWLGSFSTRRRYWAALREAGVEVRQYGPPDFWRFRNNLMRDHRKLLVVDGVRAITGGLCIGDEWAGDPTRGRQPWRDTGVAVDGPAAAVLDQAFGNLWARIGDPLPPDELASEVAACGEAEVRVLAGEPGGIRASRAIELLLAGTLERVWISDAYLVAPRGIFSTLLDAARQGVDVRLLVPSTSDLPHVRNLTRTGYRTLLDAGVRIFEWRGPMLHAKTAVADGRWVRIGSTNINLLSLIANWELDVLIDDPAFAQQMEAQFRRDLEHSAEVVLEPSRLFRGTLTFRPPEEPPPRRHAPSLRERRRRAIVAVRAAIGGSERALYLQWMLVLAVVAALLLVLPRVAGVVLATLAMWVALTATVDAIRAGRQRH